MAADVVKIKKRILARWVNSIVGNRYAHVTGNTLEMELRDGVVLVHVTSVVLDVDIFGNSSVPSVLHPKNRRDYMMNVSACLAAWEEVGIIPTCKAEAICDGNVQALVTLLFQWARCHLRGLVTRGASGNFEKFLLKDVRERLGDLKKYGSLLGDLTNVQIFNVYTNFADGKLFIALMHSADPEVANLAEAASMSTTERLTLVTDLCKERFKIPVFLTADDIGAMASPDEDCFAVFVASVLRGITRGKTEASVEVEKALVKAQDRVNELEAAQAKQDSALLKLVEQKEEDLRKVREVNSRITRNLEDAEEEVSTLQKRGDENNVLIEKIRKQIDHYEAEQRRRVSSGVPAPDGDVALMFTDVQGSTRQWAANPAAMTEALVLHNSTIRDILPHHAGYEVKTEGDAFMVAFQRPLQAINCALAIQHALLAAAWPEQILRNDDSKEVPNGSGGFTYRGLRVRIGLHFGTPLRAQDPTTHRMDYFGPMVNEAARIESKSAGGIVLASNQLLEAVGGAECLPKNMSAVDEGEFTLKGVPDTFRLWQIRSSRLEGRKYKKPDTDTPATGEVLKVELSRARKENESLSQKLNLMKRSHSQFLKEIRELQKQLGPGGTRGGDVAVQAAMSTVLHDVQLMRDDLAKLTEDNERLKQKLKMTAGGGSALGVSAATLSKVAKQAGLLAAQSDLLHSMVCMHDGTGSGFEGKDDKAGGAASPAMRSARAIAEKRRSEREAWKVSQDDAGGSASGTGGALMRKRSMSLATLPTITLARNDSEDFSKGGQSVRSSSDSTDFPRRAHKAQQGPHGTPSSVAARSKRLSHDAGAGLSPRRGGSSDGRASPIHRVASGSGGGGSAGTAAGDGLSLPPPPAAAAAPRRLDGEEGARAHGRVQEDAKRRAAAVATLEDAVAALASAAEQQRLVLQAYGVVAKPRKGTNMYHSWDGRDTTPPATMEQRSAATISNAKKANQRRRVRSRSFDAGRVILPAITGETTPADEFSSPHFTHKRGKSTSRIVETSQEKFRYDGVKGLPALAAYTSARSPQPARPLNPNRVITRTDLEGQLARLAERRRKAKEGR